MPKVSAGLLLHRVHAGAREVLLVHPGGPFWAKKDAGVWTIPKGELASGEEPLAGAIREFKEETGFEVNGAFEALGSVRQPGGKTVHAFAVAADVDPSRIASMTFSIEWPPRSGRQQTFPEIDRAAWLPLERARDMIHPAQRAFLDRLEALAR